MPSSVDLAHTVHVPSEGVLSGALVRPESTAMTFKAGKKLQQRLYIVPAIFRFMFLARKSFRVRLYILRGSDGVSIEE